MPPAKNCRKHPAALRNVRTPSPADRRFLQVKSASFLKVISQQFRDSSAACAVPKLDRLEPREFFERFYFANRPVVLRGLMRGWPALTRWTPEYFARRFVHSTVEIVDGRSRDPHYESNFLNLRRKIRMKDFVRRIEECGESNDFYLSARNFFFRRREFRPLLRDIRCPRGFLDPRTFRRRPNLFFGPKGTVTPLHHDGANILFGQIRGRKLFKLIPPFDMDKLYVERLAFSTVDLGKPDYRGFPLLRDATVLEVVVEPGEFLFIPVGWWHWVKAIDVSISLSFLGFALKAKPVIWQFWEDASL
jgi:hypothetical protein